MTTTTRHIIPTLLLALSLTLMADAQPGQARGPQRRGRQAGQHQQGPGMQTMNRPGQNPGGAHGMGILPLFRHLDLTQEQREVIRDILEANKEAVQAAHEAVQAARQSLHEAVMAGADDEAIRVIATTFAQAVGDQAIQQVAVTKEIKNVLTDDQKMALATLISQGREDRPKGPQGPPQGMGPGRGRGRRQGQGPAGPGAGE
ncbi:MAG: hypothetical protein GY809_26085 [Planctomycetes bacterium]|nr:hypothetical protein [Planctomycetota bacterium]